MIRAGVIGATGYTGAELVRILSGHPEVKLTVLTSRQHAGTAFAGIYPAMSGLVDQVCEIYDADRVSEQTDVVFMALPHKLPMAFVPELLKNGKKIIDLSADFRFSDADLYEAAYQPHTAKALLPRAVYGLSEVFTDEISGADLIGNPGCYPTSILLPLYPLLKEGFIEAGGLIADSKSGVSGAGRGLSLATHFCEVNESFKAYKVGNHRHQPEIESILGRAASRAVSITFVPHLIPLTRGMESTVYATLARKVSYRDIHDCLADYYAGRRFIRITENGRPPDTLHVRGTNFCDIGFHIDEANQRIIFMSVIDNLVKGAAGQAVQNMNLMAGLDEAAGLTAMPACL